MRNALIVFVSLLIHANVFAQDDRLWKTVLNEKFNNNRNGWHTESSTLRNAQIINGKLIDGFYEKGRANANRIPINLNTNKDYEISFSIANLNGDAACEYGVYEKRNNGTLKDAYEKYPIWGFVWGFKDWDNYNCILL